MLKPWSIRTSVLLCGMWEVKIRYSDLYLSALNLSIQFLPLHLTGLSWSLQSLNSSDPSIVETLLPKYAGFDLCR